jgi:hypothetical protein
VNISGDLSHFVHSNKSVERCKSNNAWTQWFPRKFARQGGAARQRGGPLAAQLPCKTINSTEWTLFHDDINATTKGGNGRWGQWRDARTTIIVGIFPSALTLRWHVLIFKMRMINFFQVEASLSCYLSLHRWLATLHTCELPASNELIDANERGIWGIWIALVKTIAKKCSNAKNRGWLKAAADFKHLFRLLKSDGLTSWSTGAWEWCEFVFYDSTRQRP